MIKTKENRTFALDISFFMINEDALKDAYKESSETKHNTFEDSQLQSTFV